MSRMSKYNFCDICIEQRLLEKDYEGTKVKACPNCNCDFRCQNRIPITLAQSFFKSQI